MAWLLAGTWWFFAKCKHAALVEFRSSFVGCGLDRLKSSFVVFDMLLACGGSFVVVDLRFILFTMT